MFEDGARQGNAGHVQKGGIKFSEGTIFTYHVGPGVRLGKHVAGIGSRHHKVWDNRNSLDLRGPVKLAVVTNAQWGLWGLETGIDATGGGGQHLTQRDLYARNVLGLQLVQVGTHEATEQGGSNVIRVSLCRKQNTTLAHARHYAGGFFWIKQDPIVSFVPAMSSRADTSLNKNPTQAIKDNHIAPLRPISRNIPPTNHQAVVEQAVLAQAQLTDLVRQHYTGDNGRARRSQTPTKRNRVDDMHGGLDGESALVMAAEDIEGDAGDEVNLGVEANLLGGLALVLVGDGAVKRECRGALGRVDSDVDIEMEGQGQADHIEAGTDVGGGARGSNDEGGGHGGQRRGGRKNCESEASDDSMACSLGGIGAN